MGRAVLNTNATERVADEGVNISNSTVEISELFEVGPLIRHERYLKAFRTKNLYFRPQFCITSFNDMILFISALIDKIFQ